MSLKTDAIPTLMPPKKTEQWDSLVKKGKTCGSKAAGLKPLKFIFALKIQEFDSLLKALL